MSIAARRSGRAWFSGSIAAARAGGGSTAWPPPTRPAVLDYLEGRERVLYVYEPRVCKIRVAGESIRAVCYVADRRHPQYSGRLEIEDAAAIIRAGHGERGANVDYLANTVRQLDALRIADRGLKRLWAAVERGAG